MGKCDYLESGKRQKHLILKIFFRTVAADIGTILQLYTNRQKAVAKIAAAVVLLNPPP
jgi:hypothetical protein